MYSSLVFSTALLAPLLGAVINGFIVKRRSVWVHGGLASGAVVLSFLAMVILGVSYYQNSFDSLQVTYFEWIAVGSLHIPFSFYVDALSLMMGVVITGIGSLIHIYSIGYMAEDATPYRFFSYLNLFVFAMLVLVFGSNLPVMFIGWEGVGLCSYLLIGYWYENMENAVFGMKAFVVNRIGDLGFLLGIFLCLHAFGTLEFIQMNGLVKGGLYSSSFAFDTVNLAALCLFIGAVGKSAQIPLYVWLPDAMAGPTPVSALIHAATMVTSGLVLLTRLSPLYQIADLTSEIIVWVGVTTAVFAAVIGLAQNDIKKVLAYSTVSQLGYMFAAMGVGAYVVGMFHVFTHACFKALLFLGAGSVIVGMHHEQDMRHMGGLRQKMPVTFWTMAIGMLALAGIFPFSGFFSKDEILLTVFSHPGWGKLPYVILLMGAGLTAFYMTRLMALTFLGSPRSHHAEQAHESARVITIPLICLAILSAGVGFLGMPHFLSHHNFFGEFFTQGGFVSSLEEMPDNKIAIVLALVSLGIVSLGIGSGYWLYIRQPDLPEKIVNKIYGLHHFCVNKFKVDEVYQILFVTPLVKLSQWLWRWIDAFVIDGCVNGIGQVVRVTGYMVGLLQSGNVQTYALYIVLGAVLLCVVFAQGFWF